MRNALLLFLLLTPIVAFAQPKLRPQQLGVFNPDPATTVVVWYRTTVAEDCAVLFDIVGPVTVSTVVNGALRHTHYRADQMPPTLQQGLVRTLVSDARNNDKLDFTRCTGPIRAAITYEIK